MQNIIEKSLFSLGTLSHNNTGSLTSCFSKGNYSLFIIKVILQWELKITTRCQKIFPWLLKKQINCREKASSILAQALCQHGNKASTYCTVICIVTIHPYPPSDCVCIDFSFGNIFGNKSHQPLWRVTVLVDQVLYQR